MTADTASTSPDMGAVPMDPTEPDTTDAPEDPKPSDTHPDWQAEAEKWKSLARKHESRAKEHADAAKRLAELEEADKSEVQRAIEAAADADRRAQAAELRAMRLEVATERGLRPDQAKFLIGETREEIETIADELLAAFTPPEPPVPVSSKPTERLRGGTDPTGPAPIDAKALVDSIPPTA